MIRRSGKRSMTASSCGYVPRPLKRLQTSFHLATLIRLLSEADQRVIGRPAYLSLGGYLLRNWFKPGRKSMVPYSIQWLMRFKPAWFRDDLLTLLDLLKLGKIKPLIAQRLPLQEARRAHEMLGEGGVLGKIVLLPNG